MLNKVGASSLHCGRPFFCFLHMLRSLFSSTYNLLLHNKFGITQQGVCLVWCCRFFCIRSLWFTVSKNVHEVSASSLHDHRRENNKKSKSKQRQQSSANISISISIDQNSDYSRTISSMVDAMKRNCLQTKRPIPHVIVRRLNSVRVTSYSR